MILKMNDPAAAAPLFEGWEETAIYSALAGVMGAVYADDARPLTSAMVILGDFCFFGGRADAELVRYFPEDRQSRFVIMVPQNEEWAAQIEACFPDAKRVTRYAICKDTVFDTERLRQMAEALPEAILLLKSVRRTRPVYMRTLPMQTPRLGITTEFTSALKRSIW